MEIKINKVSKTGERIPESQLGFGRYFTDHMFMMEYASENGWHDARIVPFERLSIHPASTVLHYGSEIFEGLKAYRTENGDVQLFRPMENILRMNRSAERMCLPLLDEQDAYEALCKFVEVERDWVPSAEGTSLYLRPFMFGNDEHLGVHAVDRAVFIIIASPSGNYYKEGINPVNIMIESEDVRAVKGGTGFTKCGGNYAASVRAGKRAEEKGYAQVLWLDGVHRKYIEEVGAMNVMFKIDGEVVTPALNGSILPGITRKSCLELLVSKGYKVSERLFSVDELLDALRNGKLEEAWGCGTAAVISPIGKLSYLDQEYEICGGQIGETTRMLYDTITGIQRGKLEDIYGWTVKI